MGKYLTIAKRALSSFGSHNGTSFAAAISYNAIFAIFPLILFILGFLGFFIHSTSQRQQLVNGIFSSLGQGVSKGALSSQVNAVAGGSGAIGIVGLIIAAWSASGVFSQIRTSLNVVWNVTKPRPLVQGKLRDLAMVLGVGLILLLSIVATGVLTAVQGFGNQIFGGSLGIVPHIFFAILYVIIPPAISFVAFSLIYWLVPHAELRFKDVWLGALVAAILFEIVQLGFAYYVADFGHYNKTYGALGGVIAFLFFVYLSACIVLLGGEVAKEHIDVVKGVKPASEPQQAGPSQSLPERVLGLGKGLFVDSSAHHDTARPYEPGRNESLQPPAPLVTDKEANPSQGHDGKRRNGAHLGPAGGKGRAPAEPPRRR